MKEVKCLLGSDKIRLEVGTDGPSLPILTMWIHTGNRKTFICLDKDQVEELTKILQSLGSEM